MLSLMEHQLHFTDEDIWTQRVIWPKGHTASKWSGQDLKTGLQTFRPLLLAIH